MSEYNQPLPLCDGPKLDPFPGPKPVVTFRRLLSDKDAEGHSHVFEVTINSAAYALKMFKFYDFDIQRDGLVGRENDLVPDDILQAHSDPFYNECRAYGRLEEEKLNGKVAVRCHGYLMFPAEIESQLERDFQISGFNRPREDYKKSVSSRQPIRVIVKELMLNDLPLTGKVADKMLRDLKKKRRIGIFAGDFTSEITKVDYSWT